MQLTIQQLMRWILVLAVAGGLALAGCSEITGGDDEDDDDSNGDPTTYELTVNTAPSEGGSVDPESGTYEEGETVEVTASASDGWAFTEWTGSVNAADNPLTVEITEDTEITANFEQTTSANAYSRELSITDGTNTEVLTWGMETDASDGFDDGLDNEAPPQPPEGSFYGHFAINAYNLFTDYRPVVTERTVWEIQFGPGDGTVSLSWDLSDSNHQGSLTLTDALDNPSTEIDMSAQSSFEVPDEVTTMYIIQE